MTRLGAIFPPDLPPERLRAVAETAESAGLEQLWLWEDCFKESGIAPAAAVLAWTQKLVVGIGLLPVPLRNVALTAMELATLERLFPGRTIPGVGHGVLDWMGQVGARAESPMTLLREYTDALQRLLDDESVTTSGRYVNLDGVRLDWPPTAAPPVLVGAQRPKTAALAGDVGDGLIVTEQSEPDHAAELIGHTRDAARAAGRPEPTIVAFVSVDAAAGARAAADRVAAYVAAGATDIALHSVGEGTELEQFVTFTAREVRPLVP